VSSLLNECSFSNLSLLISLIFIFSMPSPTLAWYSISVLCYRSCSTITIEAAFDIFDMFSFESRVFWLLIYSFAMSSDFLMNLPLSRLVIIVLFLSISELAKYNYSIPWASSSNNFFNESVILYLSIPYYYYYFESSSSSSFFFLSLSFSFFLSSFLFFFSFFFFFFFWFWFGGLNSSSIIFYVSLNVLSLSIFSSI